MNDTVVNDRESSILFIKILLSSHFYVSFSTVLIDHLLLSVPADFLSLYHSPNNSFQVFNK